MYWAHSIRKYTEKAFVVEILDIVDLIFLEKENLYPLNVTPWR